MVKDFKDVLLERLNAAPDRLAYSFIADNGAVRDITYARLLQRAVDIGVALGAHARAGDRVVMLLAPGVDYVASFLGCWIHGFIAVPAYPLHKNQRAARTENLIASAEPRVVLLDAPYADAADSPLPNLNPGTRPMFLSSVMEGVVPLGDLDRYIANAMTDGCTDDLVFLQYTSGSTGTPKGAMVSHSNLAHNSYEMSRKFRTSPASTMVSWLPPYHDMGLILGILQPLYVGFPCHLMTPAAFMQRPLQWLRRIAQTRATISGGPNFAFDLCTRRAAELQDEQLDLSSWETAFNGAEPINPATLRRFAATFKRHGFNTRALHPCYGLAENTLMATGQDDVPENNSSPQCYLALAEPDDIGGDPTEIVSCGSGMSEQEIAIVNPATCEPCPEGTIGELWISGRSVAKGYWQNPAETAATFHATLAGHAHGPRYLRTGDLAEMRGGKVYIRGRLKDIIIVRGVKYYPQDIERAIEEAHPQIRHGGYCAVFQSDEIQPESVSVVAEIAREHRRLNSEKLADTIRAVVAGEFRLRVSSVAILPPGRFPKTSSGKIPRTVIKTALLEHEHSTA